MKRLRVLITFVVIVCLPGYADKANSAYKRGVQAETQDKYDVAYENYKEAYGLKPKDPKYLAAYARLRFYAAAEHVHAGELLRDNGKLPEAFGEFQRAAEIDRTSSLATQEARRTADMIRKQARHEEVVVATPVSPLAKMAEQVEGPVELRAISNSPLNLRITENADQIYKVIGKLAGINVLFDPEFRPQRIRIELNDVTPLEALDMVALESKTFWQPASANTILVAADTSGKRKELQDNVMKTFYLKNVSTPTELQDDANIIRGMLDLSRVQLHPSQNALILRGTPDQMVLAEKLLSDIDKPKAEVVIDIVVMQVARDRLHTLGTNPPTSASIVMVPGQSAVSGGGQSGSGNSQFTINSLGSLNANNFEVSIPGASLSFLMSDSNTKIIQNPEIRVLDNEKATLKIGDRVPIATGSFQPGIGGGGISPLVNTQFQYLDVGVNIDIVPHVHSESEVTLKMVLEISSVTGVQNIGGISQPVIGQRRIEHETRLKDGEVNLVGGILEETETQSLSGYPWLTKIPVLKYLFGQETKEMRTNEIVFAITPHIIRAQDLTEENLRVVDVGTGNYVGLRHNDRKAPEASTPSPAPTPSRESNPPQPKRP